MRTKENYGEAVKFIAVFICNVYEQVKTHK